jgi:heptosyltransferase-2
MVAFYGALAGAAFDNQPATASSPRAGPCSTTRRRGTGCSGSATGTFAPGAEYGPAKRWPASHYAALARALHDADGTPIALLGSPGEAELCAEIAAQAGRCVPGPRRPHVAARRDRADRRIARPGEQRLRPDARRRRLRVPQVAVFGSTSPLHTPPLNERARVLWLKEELQLDCMPCFDRTCRFGHYRCLNSVAPARVESALLQAASASGAPPAPTPPSRREGLGRERS